jgi:RHS repeat-associated protein
VTRGSGSVSSAGYGYDSVTNRLATLTENLAGTAYDTSVTLGFNPAAQITSRSQSNDAAYTWLPPVPNSSTSFSYNGQNRITQAGTSAMAHDSRGNLTSGLGNFTYTYDAQNRLRSAVSPAGTVTLAYDPTGGLANVTAPTGSRDYLYDASDLIAEYVGGNIARRYIRGDGVDETVATYEGSGTAAAALRYLHADEKGSIIAASDSAGNGLGSVKYSVEGQSGALQSAFGYTGQLWVEPVGLYFYKARMYSPTLGRFVQPDPIGYGAGMNLYAYVNGDPVNFTDPSGLSFSSQLQFHMEWANRQAASNEAFTEFATWLGFSTGGAALTTGRLGKVAASRAAGAVTMFVGAVGYGTSLSATAQRTEASSIAARIRRVNAISVGFCQGTLR